MRASGQLEGANGHAGKAWPCQIAPGILGSHTGCLGSEPVSFSAQHLTLALISLYNTMFCVRPQNGLHAPLTIS